PVGSHSKKNKNKKKRWCIVEYLPSSPWRKRKISCLVVASAPCAISRRRSPSGEPSRADQGRGAEGILVSFLVDGLKVVKRLYRSRSRK
uniref:Uncharacterized protein n=1 Tax=Oryza glumipatula TaxID=40148 RepID=A0A0E0ABN5_9ORYZ